MILKPSLAVNASYDDNGYICIEQYSTEFGKLVTIKLTKDQFDLIENFVFKNKDEIELSWNEGIDDETQA